MTSCLSCSDLLLSPRLATSWQLRVSSVLGEPCLGCPYTTSHWCLIVSPLCPACSDVEQVPVPSAQHPPPGFPVPLSPAPLTFLVQRLMSFRLLCSCFILSCFGLCLLILLSLSFQQFANLPLCPELVPFGCPFTPAWWLL